MQFLGGVVLLVVSLFLYWHALPKHGEVRSYLRNDQVQAYYVVALVGGIFGGALLTVLGVISLLS